MRHRHLKFDRSKTEVLIPNSLINLFSQCSSTKHLTPSYNQEHKSEIWVLCDLTSPSSSIQSINQFYQFAL